MGCKARSVATKGRQSIGMSVVLIRGVLGVATCVVISMESYSVNWSHGLEISIQM